MKTFVKCSFLVALVVTCLLPLSAEAQGGNYFVFKGGIYDPDSNDLKGFDTGFNGELAFGHYFTRNLAVELGVGYFQTSNKESVFVPGFGEFEDKADLDVLPLTVALKGIIPVDKFELYGIGGIGAYIVWAEERLNTPFGRARFSDTDTVFGGFLGAGVNYNVTPSVYLGLEGKYLWTSKVDMKYETEFKLDGWIATFNLGFRF
jgi:outer membrane protein W